MTAPLQLLENARVFSPEPLGMRHVLVGAGRVLAITEDLPALAGVPCDRRDFGGRALVPGLIDCHAHITGGGGETGPASRIPPVALSEFTGAGVTTVVGLLGTDDTTRDTASLVATARALCDEGLTAYCYTGGYHVPPTTLTGCVRKDVACVDRIVGVGELALSDHRSSQPTLDELLRVAADAHVGGLMARKAGIVHLHLGDGERGLALVRDALERSELPARVFHPTHVNRRHGLFEEALELARRGCTVDVTAFPDKQSKDEWSAAEAWERYAAAGLPPQRVTISSDGGGCLPTFDANGQPTGMDIGAPATLATTLRELLDAGHAPEAVLPAFTCNVADLLLLDGKGRVAVGCEADFMVLDSAFGITDVMARGRWHVVDGELVVRGSFEA